MKRQGIVLFVVCSLLCAQSYAWLAPIQLLAKVGSDVVASGVSTWPIINGDSIWQKVKDKDPNAICNSDPECVNAITDVIAKRPSIEGIGALTMAANIIAAGLSITAAGVAVTDWGAAYGNFDFACKEGGNTYRPLASVSAWFSMGSYAVTSIALLFGMINAGIITGVMVNDIKYVPQDIRTAIGFAAVSVGLPLVTNILQMGVLAPIDLFRLHFAFNRMLRSTETPAA